MFYFWVINTWHDGGRYVRPVSTDDGGCGGQHVRLIPIPILNKRRKEVTIALGWIGGNFSFRKKPQHGPDCHTYTRRGVGGDRRGRYTF